MWVFCLHVCLSAHRGPAPCPRRAAEGIGPPGTGVPHGCECHVGARNRPPPNTFRVFNYISSICGAGRTSVLGSPFRGGSVHRMRSPLLVGRRLEGPPTRFQTTLGCSYRKERQCTGVGSLSFQGRRHRWVSDNTCAIFLRVPVASLSGEEDWTLDSRTFSQSHCPSLRWPCFRFTGVGGFGEPALRNPRSRAANPEQRGARVGERASGARATPGSSSRRCLRNRPASTSLARERDPRPPPGASRASERAAGWR